MRSCVLMFECYSKGAQASQAICRVLRDLDGCENVYKRGSVVHLVLSAGAIILITNACTKQNYKLGQDKPVKTQKSLALAYPPIKAHRVP